jgi:hypothetical protein
MLCPTCHAEMRPGRVYAAGGDPLHYIQGLTDPDLWTSVGQAIGFGAPPPDLGSIVVAAVLTGSSTAQAGAQVGYVITHRCDACRVHLIDEAENSAAITLDNVRTAVCARCGREGYGRDYTSFYGRPAVDPRGVGETSREAATPAAPPARVCEGSDTMFLCHSCLRRVYGPNYAVMAAAALLVGVLLVANGVRLLASSGAQLLSWWALWALMGMAIIAGSWSLIKDAVSTERDASEGQALALRILRKRNAHGDGVIYWKPEPKVAAKAASGSTTR